jgi:hypothetical protein
MDFGRLKPAELIQKSAALLSFEIAIWLGN